MARGPGFVAAPRPIPAWGTHGPGPAAVLVWLPPLLLDPALDAGSRTPAWAAWAAVLGFAALFTATVLTAYAGRPYAARATGIGLCALTAAAIGAAAAFGQHWNSTLVLVALGLGAIGPPRRAPALILAVTAAGAVAAGLSGPDWTAAWTTALTTFLAGFGTYTFHRLLTVIAELNATREELAARAVDQERLRFARDLHDLLGHTLSVIVVKAQVVRRLLPADPAVAGEHAGDIESIGRRALVEVREAVTGYRDADVARELDRAGIALGAAGIALRAGRSTPDLPGDVDALFAWVVREAVTNVIRHSGARTCRIEVDGGGGRAVLTVADDGHGGAGDGDGAGLRGLGERTAEAGGTLSVSRSRRGFTLRVEVPLTEEVP